MQREWGTDLLRLLCMAMVVVLHFFAHSGFWDVVIPGCWNYYVGRLLVAYARVAVNTFVLITGFYGIEKKFSSRRCAGMIVRVVIYSVCLSLFGILTGNVTPSPTLVLRSIFPISTKVYWFMTAYIGLLVLTPLLNTAAIELNKRKTFGFCIGTLFGMFCFLQYVYPKADTFQLNNGYSLLWFVFLYLSGGYLRICKCRICRLSSFRTHITQYVLYCGLSFVAQILFDRLAAESETVKMYVHVFTDYSSPLVFLAAVNLLLGFAAIKNNSIGRIGKLLSSLAPYSIGVYLIHEWPYLRSFLWTELFKPASFVSSPWFLLYLLFVVICIFVVGLIGEVLVSKIVGLLLSTKKAERILAGIDSRIT